MRPSQSPFSVPPILPHPDRLFVVTAISNPVRYKSRYRLYRTFEDQVRDAGAVLYTVEMAFGDRPFEVTEKNDPFDIQVRSSEELWHKENLLNIGIGRLPPEAKYIAWIDADVQFAREDWAEETIQQLQHYKFVQMFSHAQDLGPNYEPLTSSMGWVECERLGLKFKSVEESYSSSVVIKEGKGSWHSGLAWAARREALDEVGGLMDTAILGSADRNMAAALFGHLKDTLISTFTKEYKMPLKIWEDRAEYHIKRNVGVVPGLITHNWHGKKTERFYTQRWKILVDHKFNPYTDIKKDAQGLWKLETGSPRLISLRDDLRKYFRARNEDSIDTV